eukprot:scaffold4151_cov162-Amphora_coffeaeformis.AAC.9
MPWHYTFKQQDPPTTMSSPLGPSQSVSLRTRCSVGDLKEEKRESYHYHQQPQTPTPRRRTVADIRRSDVPVGGGTRQPSFSSTSIYDDGDDSPIVMLKLPSSTSPSTPRKGGTSPHCTHAPLAEPHSPSEGKIKKDCNEHHKSFPSHRNVDDSPKEPHHEDQLAVGGWSTANEDLFGQGMRNLFKSLEERFGGGSSSLQLPQQREETKGKGDPVVAILQKSLFLCKKKSSLKKNERKKNTNRAREHDPSMVHKASLSSMRHLPDIDEEKSLRLTLSQDFDDAYLAIMGPPAAVDSSFSSTASTEESCGSPPTSPLPMVEEAEACAWKSQVRVQSQLSTTHVEIALLQPQPQRQPSLQSARSSFSRMPAPSRMMMSRTMSTRSNSTHLYSDCSQLYGDEEEDDGYSAFTRFRTMSTAGWSRDVSMASASSSFAFVEDDEDELIVGPCHPLAWF